MLRKYFPQWLVGSLMVIWAVAVSVVESGLVDESSTVYQILGIVTAACGAALGGGHVAKKRKAKREAELHVDHRSSGITTKPPEIWWK